MCEITQSEKPADRTDLTKELANLRKEDKTRFCEITKSEKPASEKISLAPNLHQIRKMMLNFRLVCPNQKPPNSDC